MSEGSVLVWADAPPDYGAGRQAAMVADGLARRGRRVVLAQRAVEGAPDGAATRVALVPDDLWEGPRLGVSDRHEAADVLDRTRPAVALVNDTCPVANLAVKAELTERSIPWIAVVHGTVNPPALDTPSWRERSTEALLGAAEVVAVSGALLDELRAGFGVPPTRGCVVPNARPDEFFAEVTVAERTEGRARLGVGEDDFVALVLARVEEGKGTAVVLRALEALQGTDVWPALRILWSGDGAQRSRVIALTRLRGWGRQLTMLGYRDDPRRLLTTADVLVHVSSREGMPLSVLEAMAAGVPVIGSAIPAIEEATAGTAWLVPDPATDPAGASSGVAAALRSAHGSPAERARRGGAARGHAERHFRLERAIDRYEEVLEGVA